MQLSEKTEDMWTPYKALLKSIEFNLTRDLQAPSAEMEVTLRKYKQNFFNLLQNSVIILTILYIIEVKLFCYFSQRIKRPEMNFRKG